MAVIPIVVHSQTASQVELLRGRDDGSCGHEVFAVSFPPQPLTASRTRPTVRQQPSVVALQPAQFAELHPFHIAFDNQMRVVQLGAELERLLPQLVPGVHLADMFEVRTGMHKRAGRGQGAAVPA